MFKKIALLLGLMTRMLFSVSALAAVNAAALRSFVWLAEDEELVALDWQHPAYRYSAARQVVAASLGSGRSHPCLTSC